MADAFLSCGPLTAHDGNGRRLFEDVVLEVFEGELTVLAGPSGSGKSTFLRQLAGLVAAPDAVRLLAGRPYSPRELASWRSQVTLLAQGGPVLPGTVVENLEFPFNLRHAGGRSFAPATARSLLDGAGLSGIDFDRDASSLSGGERHRFCLVRGLLWDPPVLVADEPLEGLDEGAAARCFDLLLDQAHRPGRAVVCVLHDSTLGKKADRNLRLTAETGGSR